MAAINAGQLHRAADQLAAALQKDAGNARAHHLDGVVAMMLGRPGDAVTKLSRAIACDPQLAAAHSNLGLARLEAGFGDEALADCRRAVALQPSDPEMVFNLAVVQEGTGQFAEAGRSYRQVLELVPQHAGALLNLATVLHRQGQDSEARQQLQAGLQHYPEEPAFLRNLAHLELGAGSFEAAADAFSRVLKAQPDDLDARAGLAATRRRSGAPHAAIELCTAVDSQRQSADLCRQLGLAYLAVGKLEAAIEAFERGLAKRRRPGDLAAIAVDQRETTLSKLRHDQEQLQWLMQRQLLAPEFADAPGLLAEVLAGLPDHLPAAGVFDLPFGARRRLQAFYNRLLHRASPAKLSGGALNPQLDSRAVEADYHAHAPGMTVLDNFLRPAALSGLRRFCQESTFWFDFRHPNGYLGAYLEEGFYCPLLLQVAEDLRKLMPGVIGKLPLRQMWAYKYDSRLEGIEMHADFAAVNVNFWITRESANLDEDSGGMVVWDKEAPDDWDFEHYNSSADEDQANIRRFLESSGARPVTVPYRENRAVIFNSDLFHKTDRINFAEGYENRRINITMLFGTRQQELE